MSFNPYFIPTETDEQIALFTWAAMARYEHPEIHLLYHIPNSGRRHRTAAGRMKAECVKSGVPDLCLPVARVGYHGLYIERRTQRAVKQATNNLNGLKG